MRTVQERFEEKVEKGGGDECWEWMASKTWGGYGYFGLNGKAQYAHRVAYELYLEEIPDGFQVFHYCNNPSCVNPSHLFLKTPQERFEKKFVKGGANDCWEWIGSKDRYGYGHIQLDGWPQLAHRISYQLYVGEIPIGLLICHHCDNPSCVRPDHLFLGTDADNTRDCISKGRLSDRSGENNGQAKLTNEDIRTILAMWANGTRGIDIAREFGVTKSTISKIVRGDAWTHILKEND